MKQIPILILPLGLSFAMTAFGQDTKNTETASATVAPQLQQPPAVRVVDLKASDGTI